MKTSLIACLLFICFSSFGFELDESYNWDVTFDPTKYDSLINHEEDATIVFDKSLYYYYNSNYYYGKSNDQLKLLQFEHRLIWIENESAIEKLNQMLHDF